MSVPFVFDYIVQAEDVRPLSNGQYMAAEYAVPMLRNSSRSAVVAAFVEKYPTSGRILAVYACPNGQADEDAWVEM